MTDNKNMRFINDTNSAIQTLQLFENFGIAAMVCTQNGIIQLINNTAALLFGKAVGDFDGLSINDIDGFAALVPHLDADEPITTSVECRLMDDLHCAIRMQKIGKGGCVFTFEDITLYKSREEAQNAAVQMVAHDLRTPLSAIKSYAELATQSGEMNPKQAQFLERIRLAVQTMNGLVRDLLDIAWIDSGGLPETRLLNIGHLAQMTVDSLEERSRSQSVSVDVRIAPDLPPIVGDGQRLERVLSNLIGNAIKYTPSGGTVEVRVSEAKQHLTISVTDTGIGIPNEHLPYIFNRFYRVPREDESIDGTGLGLSIVKAIVEKHNGKIEVKSETGKGSTFMIILPIQEPVAKEKAMVAD
jgi:signal transduction histidine kinase